MHGARRSKSRLHYVRSITRKIWTHPNNRGRRLTALGRGVWWQARKRLLKREQLVPAYGMQFICSPGSGSASNYHYFGDYYEYDEMHFLRRYLRLGDAVVDGGANVGTFTLLLASLVGPTGEITSVEPSPEAALLLRRQVQLNGLPQCRVVEAALGAEPGFLSFTAGLDVSNRLATSSDTSVVQVRVETLDDLVQDHPCIFVKLDLEGAEAAALKGAGSLLARQRPVWQVELLDGQLKRFGASAQLVLEQFEVAGYRAATYEEDRRQLRIFARGNGRTNHNLLLVPQEGIGAVSSRLADAGVSVLVEPERA